MNNRLILAGASLAGLGVALGAFGAHGLKSLLSPESLSVFETGVRYQMYHSLAVLICGLGAGFSDDAKHWQRAAICFLGGIVLFSGSLYALALTGISWLGIITPAGGLLFLAGWIVLAVGASLKVK